MAHHDSTEHPTVSLSPTHSSHSEAVSTINHNTEDRDTQTYKDLCQSRINLLDNQYYLLKDTLHRAMVLSDMWWAAENAKDTQTQEMLGTDFIDEIIEPYLINAQTLLDSHEDRFDVDEPIRKYLDICADSVVHCFTPQKGKTHNQARVEKGLTVRPPEVCEISELIGFFRKKWGRLILLEKGVRDHGFDRILKRPDKPLAVTSWSLLWNTLERKEDRVLWSIVALEDLEDCQRDAFRALQRERLALLKGKIELAEDYWRMKLELDDRDDLLLDQDDEEWADIFESSSVKRFEMVVRGLKLRLMKDFNICNFRFLGPLTDRIGFDEDLHARTLQSLDRKDWAGFVEYRMTILKAEREQIQRLQFLPLE